MSNEVLADLTIDAYWFSLYTFLGEVRKEKPHKISSNWIFFRKGEPKLEFVTLL